MWWEYIESFEEVQGNSSQGTVQPNIFTFNAVISSCEQQGQWQQASWLLEIHGGTCVPDVVTCSALISCCEKAGVWQPALSFLAMMHVTHLKLSVVSSTSAMSATVRVQRWQQTLQVFHHMRRHELQPNVIGFSAAMTSCEVGSQWHLAPSLFQDVGMSWQQLQKWKKYPDWYRCQREGVYRR